MSLSAERSLAHTDWSHVVDGFVATAADDEAAPGRVVDTIVVGPGSPERPAGMDDLVLEGLGFTRQHGQVVLVPSGPGLSLLVCIHPERLDVRGARSLGARAARAVPRGWSWRWDVGALSASASMLSALAAGAASEAGHLDRVELGTGRAIERGRRLGRSVAHVRRLVDEPAGTMSPEHVHAVAGALAERFDLAIDVRVGVDALAADGFGGIAAVGRAAAVAPRLVSLHYRPDAARRRVGLVGKGVCFDAGGLTMKAREGLSKQKFDMAGAAVVLGALAVVAAEQVPVAVDVHLPLVENLVSGSSTHPGDLVRLKSGVVAEIVNTDAEGRVILSDAIAHAAASRPDLIVDVATLTYACPVALGDEIAGLMALDDAAADRVARAAASAGELVHRLPMHEPYRALLRSSIADLKNSVADGGLAGQNGGAITAAWFIAASVPSDQPWVHLDIAGPAWSTHDDGAAVRKGPTGFGVATLVDLVESFA